MRQLFCGLAALLLSLAPATPTSAAPAPLRVALLLESPVGDQGWNDGLVAGLERAGRAFALATSVRVAPDPADKAALYAFFQAAARENDMVLVASDRLHEALRDNAGNFRRVRFGCVDAGIRAPNIMCVTYADEQAAYLAGAAAAMLAQRLPEGRNALGWLSGEDTPAMRSLLNGFTEGARVVTPGIRVIHAVSGASGDAAAGGRAARELLGRGCAVLALACGLGDGPALSAVAEHKALAITVNRLPASLPAGLVPIALDRHPDTAVYDLVAAAATDRFAGKQILVRDLAGGGVDVTGLAAFGKTARMDVRDIERRLGELRREILTGGVRLKSLRARTLCDCR